jgi:hypothetical protein
MKCGEASLADCSGYRLLLLAAELRNFPNLWRGCGLRSSPGIAPAGEPPEREADVLRRTLALVAKRLPPGWSTHVAQKGMSDRLVDAVIELVGPDDTRAMFVVEAKRSVVTRDLPALLEQLRSYESHAGQRPVPLLAARYIGSSARAWLEERGVSYVDATGNMHILLERPALFLHDRGADRDPWRGPGRPRGTLHGPPAARVVRALVDFVPPMTVPELVRRSAASTGATYRVVEFLEREALVDRDPRGPITNVAWRRLLERWSQDYGFQRSNTVGAYLYPRGLPALLDGLRDSSGLRYVLTGSFAAHRLAPYAPARLAMIHVDDPEQAAEQLKLRAVDSGANVLLAAGDYDVVFDRVIEDDSLNYAAPSQTAVDLLTGPGRGPAEGQALLDWMEKHEPAWRR